jgi:hypothetical protein
LFFIWFGLRCDPVRCGSRAVRDEEAVENVGIFWDWTLGQRGRTPLGPLYLKHKKATNCFYFFCLNSPIYSVNR